MQSKNKKGEVLLMALQDVYDYFRSYDKSTYEVVACQGNEPTEEDVAAFEKKYKMKLPEEFREFTMSPLGGLFMEVREEVWPRGKQFDIGPFWSFLRGIIVYGIANNIPDFLSLDVRTNQLHKEGFKTWASIEPIVDLKSSLYCIEQTLGFCDLYKIGLMSGGSLPDKKELEVFVGQVCHFASIHGAKVYWKDSLKKYLGHDIISSAAVNRDYRLIKSNRSYE